MRPELEGIIQHHGIKGMHWGKHKKKEIPVEVQKAKVEVGKRKKERNDAKQQFNREFIKSTASTKRLASANNELRYAKEDLSKVKILNKINGQPKSKAQLKYEEKYKAKGMSADDATVAAYKRVRFNKIAIAAAATTLAVAGAYAGYKVHDARVDKILKSGTTLQHITAESDMGIRDAFYSSKNALDKTKYAGLYSQHLKVIHGTAYKKEIKVLTDIKQASPKNAHKILDELFKNDPEFNQGMRDILMADNVHKNLGPKYMTKALRSRSVLNSGTVNKDAYEVFNASIVDHSPNMQKLTDRYFKALSDKGYNAIKDVNDSKYSGYKALNPIIAFNSKGKVNVVDVKELAQKEINKNAGVAYAHLIGSELAAQGAITAAALTGSVAAAKYGNQKLTDKQVAKYRNANPKTKMTNTEIARMLERGKLK